MMIPTMQFQSYRNSDPFHASVAPLVKVIGLVLNLAFYITKLKGLFFFKEFVEGMVEGYPVLETLKLTTCRHKTNPVDDRALSTTSFPRLTFLFLRGFDLKDGFALLSVIVTLFK